MISLSLKRIAPLPLQGWEQMISRTIRAGRRHMSTGIKVGAYALLLGGTLLGATFVAQRLSAVTAQPTLQEKVAKSVSTSAVAPAKCQSPQSGNTAQFAACPSFTLDFTKQRAGSADTNIFNIYQGAPEANHEAQLYTGGSQNLRVENGALVLEAHQDAQQGYAYTSARIDTRGKEDFLYGKLTVRAQLPNGIGSWPAIWMLPSSPRYASLSPASDYDRYLNDGEIDLMEAVGTQPDAVYGIAHSRAYPADGPDRSYYNVTKVANNDTTFHDYTIEWTPTTLTFSVDGQPYFTYTKKAGADYKSWPFDQPFYLILNLALGGTWGGTDTTQFPGDGVDKSALPSALKVQSINYYPYIGK